MNDIFKNFPLLNEARERLAINVTKTWLPDIYKFKGYVDEIYESGWVTSYSPLVRKLESRLADYLGVKNIVLVSDGTAALDIAYKLMKLKGEVITTPFSFVATTSSIVNAGLKPIFADIETKTFNINCENIESLITSETSAIVPVHTFGNACDIEAIDTLAKKYKLKVIYDAAHTFNVTYRDKSILSYGDVSIISFNATKLFHTVEGGALIINDDSLVNEARMLANFGINGTNSIGPVGVNAKMNEFQAAMGLCVLDDMDYILSKRKEVDDFYRQHLSPKLGFQVQNISATQNYSYMPIVLPEEGILLNIIDILSQDKIYPRRYFYPSLDTLQYIEPKQYCPASRDLASKILCLPIYPDLDKEVILKIARIINQFL